MPDTDLLTWPHRFTGGVLCLDFINTIDLPGTPRERDLLGDYAALLHWSVARRQLGIPAWKRLARLADALPAQAAAAWREAIALRAEIRAIAEAAKGDESVVRFIPTLNKRLARLSLPPHMRAANDGIGLTFALSGETLEEPLWPVLWTLSAFVVSEDVHKLGACQASDCNAIFVDHTNNRSRIWCSSEGCGNRERVRRAYRARRAERTGKNLGR